MSEIQVGQRFTFNILSGDPAPGRQAVVTRVLSNREEGFGPEVDFFFSYWVEAHELPETEVPTTLVFERGTDGNAYLDGRLVSITMLKDEMGRQQPPEQTDAARTIHSKENVDMQAAIQECETCHDVCVSTMTHCLDQGSRHAEAHHIKALLDCIDFCATCAGFMLRDSLAHRRVCEICAEVCDACAVSCEGFPDDRVVSECAKECRRCAESCRKMARAPHHAEAPSL